MKEPGNKPKRRIGDVINELSGKPIPFTLEVADRTFELFLHPLQDSSVTEKYSQMVGEGKSSEKNLEGLRFLISECVRDENGDKVWDSPDDFKVKNRAIETQLVMLVSRKALGINDKAFELKNLPGSPSSSTASK